MMAGMGAPVGKGAPRSQILAWLSIIASPSRPMWAKMEPTFSQREQEPWRSLERARPGIRENHPRAQSLPVIESTLCGCVDIPTVQELQSSWTSLSRCRILRLSFGSWTRLALGFSPADRPAMVVHSGRSVSKARTASALRPTFENVRMIVRALGTLPKSALKVPGFAAAQSALRQGDLAAFRR